MQRVTAYVDGFNPYFGLKDSGFMRYYWLDYEEKMTDVNIVIQLLGDAFDNAFDTALVISGDSDLTTPIRRVRERFAKKRVVVAFPPRETLNKLLRGRIAALRGARSLAYLLDMSRSLRSVRLALHPARGLLQRFPSQLKRCANGYLNIGEDKLRACQLPEQLVKPDGYVLTRPDTWR